MGLIRKADLWLRGLLTKKARAALTPKACSFCHAAVCAEHVSPQPGFVFCDFTCQIMYRDAHRSYPNVIDLSQHNRTYRRDEQ